METYETARKRKDGTTEVGVVEKAPNDSMLRVRWQDGEEKYYTNRNGTWRQTSARTNNSIHKEDDMPEEFRGVETKPTELRNKGMGSYVPDRLPTGKGVQQAVAKKAEETGDKIKEEAASFAKALKKSLRRK